MTPMKHLGSSWVGHSLMSVGCTFRAALIIVRHPKTNHSPGPTPPTTAVEGKLIRHASQSFFCDGQICGGQKVAKKLCVQHAVISGSLARSINHD
mmetsp:Transcript_791/g.2676  ORF Transcript_791/g.2676 Transcript_791/m.2676 type:complete len:95 (-) Transcript_791:437-721(-)